MVSTFVSHRHVPMTVSSGVTNPASSTSDSYICHHLLLPTPRDSPLLLENCWYNKTFTWRGGNTWEVRPLHTSRAPCSSESSCNEVKCHTNTPFPLLWPCNFNNLGSSCSYLFYYCTLSSLYQPLWWDTGVKSQGLDLDWHLDPREELCCLI